MRSGSHDADPAWLVAAPLWQQPWYLFYIVVNVGAAIVALVRRCRSAFALAAATALAMMAAASSLPLDLRAHLSLSRLLDGRPGGADMDRSVAGGRSRCPFHSPW